MGAGGIQIFDEATLGTLDVVGNGGQGVVYSTSAASLNGRTLAYKRFHQAVRPQVEFALISKMIARLGSLSPSVASELISRCAWPVALVQDQVGLSGFLMPLAPRSFSGRVVHSRDRFSEVVCGIEFLLNEPGLPPYREVELDMGGRLLLLRHIATTIEMLHTLGITVPDLSAKNILYSPRSPMRGFFVDCDSMAVDGRSPHPIMETLDWSSAHIDGSLGSMDGDLYKFGLLALRIIVGSQNAHTVPGSGLGVPGAVRRALVASISAEPAVRPSANTWVSVLAVSSV